MSEGALGSVHSIGKAKTLAVWRSRSPVQPSRGRGNVKRAEKDAGQHPAMKVSMIQSNLRAPNDPPPPRQPFLAFALASWSGGGHAVEVPGAFQEGLRGVFESSSRNLPTVCSDWFHHTAPCHPEYPGE